jgi:ribosome biogenesis GTPase / thiamine phosphate phosphatase
MGNHTNSATTRAVVIATYSREMDLRLISGEVVRARIKGKKLKPVCGDRVLAVPIENEPEWLITAIDKRDNELARPNMRGQIEILAANLDHLCVVAACSPPADWFIIDRYLCAAEIMNIDATVVYNKADLDGDSVQTREALEVYRDIGYATLLCSAQTGQNMEQLRQLLAARTSIIAGQSGVGKSSIINYLLKIPRQRTSKVSKGSGAGKHTTVNSVMLDIEDGGKVIDSPGVRDYAPATQTNEEVVSSFREIKEAGYDCRFANCRHLLEPDCAVKKGIESGTIDQRRYDSYRRLIVLSEQLAKKR